MSPTRNTTDFNVLSNITIGNYTGEPFLDLNLKYGHYSVFYQDGHLFLTTPELNIKDAEWLFIGDDDDGYASTGSDFPWLFIKNSSEVIELIDEDLLFDKELFLFTNDNVFYYEIPCNNAGGVAVYKTFNQSGEIVGLMITDMFPDDMEGFICISK